MQQAEYKSLRTVAKWVTGALALYLAADAYQILISLEGLGFVETSQAGEVISAARVAEFEDAVDQTTIMTIGSFLLVVIGFCIWTYRAAKNAVSFGGHLQHSPGWAVGFYFVPILNLWKPYQAISDVWRFSHPEADRDLAASIEEPTPWWFKAWWLAWIVSGVIDQVAVRKLEGAANIDQLEGGLHWWLGSVLFDVVAVLLLLGVVWSLTRRQEARAAAMPRAEVVAES